MPSAQVFIVIVGIKITVIVTMMIFMVITGLSICISPGAAAATSLNGQLSFTSYSYVHSTSQFRLLAQGEMTVSFYFSIDNLGEDKRIEKRFGFRLGQIEVYFVPETDITDIGQFRRGVGEPQIEYLDEAAFLEGEMMRVVFQIHQDHLSSMHLCKTSSDKNFEKSLELNRLGFCNAASRATDFLGIFADGPDCEKCYRLLPAWSFRRLLWMISDGCNKQYTGLTRGMKACSAILKSIDLLILRPEDKGALMPHLGKLVRLFDFLISMEMSDQCGYGCTDLSLSPNCLSADARRAHRDNVIARNETGSTEVNSTIRLQNAALFCLSALGLPQSSAELQDKGCILEKKERAVGRLHPDDAARLLRLLGTKRDGEEEAVGGLQAHPAVFPAYTLMCVVALKRELCIKAASPSFQALIVNESNLPNVYVSLEDFTVCVQVRTKSGRLESAQSSISIVDQAMPVAVTVVVDGLLVFLYLNGKEALDQPKRLSDYAAEVQAGEILCGRSMKAVQALERGELRKEEDPVLAGVMLMMRFFPRAMVAYEVDSKMGVARSQAAKVLKRKPGSASDEIPLTVYNIIEVTQLVIQFTHVQLSDESLAAMGKKKAGLQEVLDPDTIMWMVLALGTAAIYLPHQHPKFLELIKQPFVKVMQMIAGIIDGASSKQQLSNYEQAFIAACTVYVAFVLASPRGKNIMQDDLAAKLIIKMNAFSDSPIDFSDYDARQQAEGSSGLFGLWGNSGLVLEAVELKWLLRQETPATLALVLDAVITRIVNEDGVIFKEDLQEFLVDQGLGAVVQVLHFVGRGLLNIERRERDRKKMTAWLTTGENEERARQEKADRLALEQVGTLAARMHRQLFLQLHHVMDEVIHGLPLDEVRMVGTVLEVPQVIFLPAKSLRAERMQDIEVAEGMPYECWRNVSELSCDKLRVWTEKFYPMSLRTFGEVSTMLEDLQEQVVVRDRRHISSPRLEIGAMHTNRAGALVQVEGDRGNAVRWRVLQLSKVWIHFQSSQPEFLTDTEVRILPVHDPPLELPRKKSGHKYCAEPSRLVAFANAVLRNPRFNDEVYANTVVLLAELNLPELYTSMVQRIAHSSFTPAEGFEEFLQPPPKLLPEGSSSTRAVPTSMKPAHDISTGVPEEVQVSVVGLATMIIARDINACEQAILENQYHVDGDKPFFLWRTFADLVSSRKRDLQKAAARFLNTLFWRLPRLLDALGHPDDEAVEDLLQVLSPLASSVQAVKKEDLEEEFAHLVFVPQPAPLQGAVAVQKRPVDLIVHKVLRKLLKQRKVENRWVTCGWSAALAPPRLEQVPDSLLSLPPSSVQEHIACCASVDAAHAARAVPACFLFKSKESHDMSQCLRQLALGRARWGVRGLLQCRPPGQGDIFAPARNLVGSDESKCREGLRVTFESEIEARTNKPKATTWSILEGVIAAALPAAPGGLAGLAGGYGAIPNGYVDLQRYSPYGVAGLQTAAMPAGYGAVQGAMPGMAMGGVALSGGMPGALQGALPAGYAVLPGTAGVQLSAPTAVPALPPGWEQAVDPASGKVYYANRSTGETSWIPPAAAPTQLPPMLVAQTAPAAALATAPAQTQTAPAAAAAEATAPASEPATAPAEAAPAEAQADGTTAPAEASQAQPAEAQPALPAGWEQGVDATSGKTYYYNRATNQSSWTIPTA
ncbi:NEDD4L [Symbiodinium microadriaticum]|nr:NEDD4L [Symbiodinium microadriaticum]